jgi:hypothetical protein
MKWTSSVLSFVTGGIVCLTICLLVSSNYSARIVEEHPYMPSMIVPPDVPSQATFSGETIDLKRYNMYEGMDRELSSFTYFHSGTLLLLKRANRYFPVIEPILKANGIPDDFKYLAVIESNLDPCAVSPSRAVGMWQLMEATGKEMKLNITPTVDERYHVQRSTEAACRYLKAAYAKYGDWVKVAASYNAGMGRISSETTRQQVDSALDLWLVEETSRYVYRILAAKLIFEDPGKYGFAISSKHLYKPFSCKEVTVSEDIPDLVAYAKEQDITLADLKRFNPWLRDSKLTVEGKTFVLQIPRKEDIYYDTSSRTAHNPQWLTR